MSPKYIPTKNIGEGYWNKAEASGGIAFFFFMIALQNQSTAAGGEILNAVLVGQIQS